MDEKCSNLTDMCLVCSELMGEFKSGLAELTRWSQKPLFYIFGKLKINIPINYLHNLLLTSRDLYKHQHFPK